MADVRDIGLTNVMHVCRRLVSRKCTSTHGYRDLVWQRRIHIGLQVWCVLVFLHMSPDVRTCWLELGLSASIQLTQGDYGTRMSNLKRA